MGYFSSKADKESQKYLDIAQPQVNKFTSEANALARPDLQLTPGQEREYTNFNTELNAQKAMQAYRGSLGSGMMRSSMGRAQAGDIANQARIGMLQQSAANRYQMADRRTQMAQQMYGNDVTRLGLMGQGAEMGMGLGSQVANIRNAENQAANDRINSAVKFGLGAAGALVGGIGSWGGLLGTASTAVDSLKGGIPTSIGGVNAFMGKDFISQAPKGATISGAPKMGEGNERSQRIMSVFGSSNRAKSNPSNLRSQRIMNIFGSTRRAANGTNGLARDKQMIVGDGGNAPELLNNPTGAPIEIIPLTANTTSQVKYMPNPYRHLTKYACGTAPHFKRK